MRFVHFVDHCFGQQKQPLAWCTWQDRILELPPRPTDTLVPFENTVAVELFTLGAPTAVVAIFLAKRDSIEAPVKFASHPLNQQLFYLRIA
jgi:hypothetical protein